MFTSTLLLAVLFALPAHAANLNVDELKTLATAEAVDHDLDPKLFLAVVGCESNWDTLALGDNGHSHGLVQIFSPAHPDITVAEANSPYFSLHYMAEEWSKGDARRWTCWRQLYKKSTSG